MLLAFIVLFIMMRTLNMDQIAAILVTPDHPIAGAITPELRFGLFMALFIAFAIKLPVFPFHTWMLKVHVQAPPSIVMIHSGILLKMGAYGLLRMGVGFFPEQAYQFSTWLAVLGIINVLYGAMLAFVQKDLKMVLAYSSISHMGIVLLGLAAMNTIGFQGAVGALGIVLTAVYLLRAILRTTFGPTPDRLSGLADAQPMEVIPMVVLLGCIILIGVYPAVLGNPMQQALQTIVPIVTGIGG
jgi:NADH-quinone oxidoreductase subunit M